MPCSETFLIFQNPVIVKGHNIFSLITLGQHVNMEGMEGVKEIGVQTAVKHIFVLKAQVVYYAIKGGDGQKTASPAPAAPTPNTALTFLCHLGASSQEPIPQGVMSQGMG